MKKVYTVASTCRAARSDLATIYQFMRGHLDMRPESAGQIMSKAIEVLAESVRNNFPEYKVDSETRAIKVLEELNPKNMLLQATSLKLLQREAKEEENSSVEDLAKKLAEKF